MALQLDADVLLFGTGASVRSDSGKIEAEHIRALLTDDVTKLRRFRGHFDAFSNQQLQQLAARTQTELTSMNTVQEIRAAATIFAERNLQRMVLVSSSTHVPRCLRDASVVLAELRDSAANEADRDKFQTLLQNLFVTPSDIPYHNATPAMVQVFEPPHRPDTAVSFDRLVARLFAVPTDQRQQFANQFELLLQKFNV